MTRPETAEERIRNAQRSAQLALKTWNGAHFLSIAECEELLQSSVSDLQYVHDAVVSGDFAPSSQLRAAVVVLRDQICQLTKTVDASAAFVRGLTLYSDPTFATYNAAGGSDCNQARGVTPHAGIREL